MTSIYDRRWPVNLAQQQQIVGQLEQRVRLLEARRQTITIRSRLEPTQGDWETAWVAKTGLGLPIPPGSRLYWYDLTRGVIKPYTVPLDQSNGRASSGNAVPYVDDTYDRPPFRLLAYGDDLIMPTTFGLGSNNSLVHAAPVHQPHPGASFTFPYNIYTLVKAGLQSLMLVYRLRFETTDDAIKLYVHIGGGSTSQVWFLEQANAETGSVWMDVTQPASAVATAQVPGGSATQPMDGRFVAGKVTNQGSIAGGYSQGTIWIDNILPQNEGGAQVESKPMAQGIHVGCHIDDSLATAKFGFSMGAFYKLDQMPARFLLSGIGNNQTAIHSYGKLWVYGMFSKNTQKLEEGDLL